MSPKLIQQATMNAIVCHLIIVFVRVEHAIVVDNRQVFSRIEIVTSN
jgi:hypothetical protein